MNIQSPMIQLPPPNIPSEDGYVMFIGVVNMMAHKCMINGGTVALKYLFVLARFFSPTTFKMVSAVPTIGHEWSFEAIRG